MRLSYKIMALFLDNETRTLEEIHEWVTQLTPPEKAYRKSRNKSLASSIEAATRDGMKEVTRQTLRNLLWTIGWLCEADGKLAINSTPNTGDYSFRLTEAGRLALHGKASESQQASNAFKTQIWKFVTELYDAGKIRIKLQSNDGSPVNASALRNNGVLVTEGK